MAAIKVSESVNTDLGEKILALFPNRKFIVIYYRDRGDENTPGGIIRSYQDGDMSLNDWKAVHAALDRGVQDQLNWAIGERNNRGRIV